jgi:hypothetical protein
MNELTAGFALRLRKMTDYAGDASCDDAKKPLSTLEMRESLAHA